MSIRTLKSPLPPEAHQYWLEMRDLLVLAEQCIAQGEQAGREMSACRELGEALRQRWEQFGWTYYPQEMPTQSVE